MKDTHKNIQEIQRDILMNLSGEERLKIGSSMFTSARCLMLARLQTETTDPIELQVKLFQETYQSDFSKIQLENISNHIKAYWQK